MTAMETGDMARRKNQKGLTGRRATCYKKGQCPAEGKSNGTKVPVDRQKGMKEYERIYGGAFGRKEVRAPNW